MIAVIHRGERFKEIMEQFQQNKRSLLHRKSGVLMRKPYGVC